MSNDPDDTVSAQRRVPRTAVDAPAISRTSEAERWLDSEVTRINTSSTPYDTLGVTTDNSALDVYVAFLSRTEALSPGRFACFGAEHVLRAARASAKLVGAVDQILEDHAAVDEWNTELGTAAGSARSAPLVQATPPIPATRPTSPPGSSVPADKQPRSDPTATRPDRRRPEVFTQALDMMARGMWGEAVVVFRKLTVVHSQDLTYRVYFHYATARLHDQEGDLDAARTQYRRALGLSPTFAAARAKLLALDSRRL